MNKEIDSDLNVSPSFRMAIIRTMNGAKSNFHIKAMNMNPNCQIENITNILEFTIELSITA